MIYLRIRRDRPWLPDPKVLAPHLTSGWVTGLGWCSTRHRGRYGRKRSAVDYPYHGYRPRVGSAPAQLLFPLNERRPRKCVPGTVRLRHAGVRRSKCLTVEPGDINAQFAQGSRGCRPETRPDHA